MLECKNLKKSFTHQLFAIDEIQFGIGIHIISGENGVGKSTLFSLISRTDDEYDGDILLAGKNIKDICIEEYKTSYVTYVKQHINLFNTLSVDENIKILVGDNYKENKYYKYLIDGFAIDDKILNKKKLTKLSGGEKQKIQIIIGLLINNPILLLDEVDNNLDKSSINFLIEAISEIRTDKLTLVISHMPKKFINVCNSHYVLGENHHTIVDEQMPINSFKHNKYAKNNLTKDNIKQLSRYTMLTKTLVMTIIIIMTFITIIFSAYTTVFFKYLSQDVDVTYTNNASLINVPYESSLYDLLGDDSWLKTTSGFFTQTQIDNLNNLDYVKTVIPIPSRNIIDSSAFQIENQKYLFEQIITIDDNQLVDDLSLDMSGTYSVYLSNLVYPYKYLKNVPFALENSKLYAGDYPKDNSDEILIPLEYAIYLIDENEFDNIDSIVNSKITLNLIDSNENEVDKQFIISGIYNSPENMSTERQIYYSFNQQTEIYNKNLCNYPYSDNSQEDRKRCLEAWGYKYSDDFGVAPSLYVEVKSSDDLKNLDELIYEFDPFIEVANNYTINEKTNKVLFKSFIQKKLILISIFMIIFVVLQLSIKKLYINELNEPINVLKTYGYSDAQINKIIKKESRQIVLNSIIICLVVLVSWSVIIECTLIFLIVETLLIIFEVLIINQIYKKVKL